jgi:hypothetical protein
VTLPRRSQVSRTGRVRTAILGGRKAHVQRRLTAEKEAEVGTGGPAWGALSESSPVEAADYHRVDSRRPERE